MSEKSKLRKQALAKKLIDVAQMRIEKDGLQALRARDLATDAGCSLGAIYNVYADLNAVILAVNGRTFQKLGRAVADSVAGQTAMPPTEKLITMSNAYLRFADTHKNLWRALFDLQMSSEGHVPDWYLTAMQELFQYIAEPLAELFPQKDAAELDLMTRALFSSVHGIVLLGLEKRISGVPIEKVEMMIFQVLSEVGKKI